MNPLGYDSDWYDNGPGSEAFKCTMRESQVDWDKVHSPLAKLKEIKEKYNELIMAVSNKYPNESRHETALRYIIERENSCGGEGSEKGGE